jgi:hypothetical protein
LARGAHVQVGTSLQAGTMERKASPTLITFWRALPNREPLLGATSADEERPTVRVMTAAPRPAAADRARQRWG